jgi:hypothetical protein
MSTKPKCPSGNCNNLYHQVRSSNEYRLSIAVVNAVVFKILNICKVLPWLDI